MILKSFSVNRTSVMVKMKDRTIQNEGKLFENVSFIYFTGIRGAFISYEKNGFYPFI